MDPKPEFRAHLKARRDALPADSRIAWSAAIAGQLERLCRNRRFTRIGAFWPLGSEIDLRSAVSDHPDWLWFFPRVASTQPPRLVWGTEPLEKGHWGLMEPALAQHFLPPVQLLLVPGLAFDDEGYRIGYGRGFYDALLSKLPEEVFTVGVGFEAQMHLSVPVEPHDWPVQALLSERGLRQVEVGGWRYRFLRRPSAASFFSLWDRLSGGSAPTQKTSAAQSAATESSASGLQPPA